MTTSTIDPRQLKAIERSPGYWRTVLRRFGRDKVAVAAALVVLALVLMAIFAPWIVPQDPTKGMTLRRLKPVGTPGFLLGTDELGRDMLSRLIMGARLSLFMGVTPVFLALIGGGTIGIVAGYAGGWLNTILMRTIDVFYAFPSVAKSGMNEVEFADSILSEEQVAVVPGLAFGEGGDGYVRLSYAMVYEKLEKALERFASFMRRHG